MTTAIGRPAASRYRWTICALLFVATVVAYLDRGILGFLKVDLGKQIGWNDVTYGNISSAFKWGYGFGIAVAGYFTDWLGTRKAFAIAIVLWSLAAMSPGMANSAFTFGAAMFLLGICEAANFPACQKTVAEWFPKKERALATSLFNSGANVGNMLPAAVVPVLVVAFAGPLGKDNAWRGAFAACGSIGFIWLAFWLRMYRKPESHPKVSAEELAYIQSDPAERSERVPWGKLLPCKETWAFGGAKFLTDGVWWFYSFWLPGYWMNTFHQKLGGTSLPLIIAFGVSILGGIGGGYLSGALIKRGWSVGPARKTAMLICAVSALPIVLMPFVPSLWWGVALAALAMAAHQAFSCNLFTVPSDLFPKVAVGSVIGIGGALGAAGGGLLDQFVSHIVLWTHSYVLVFALCGSAYLLGLLLLHLLTPKYAPAQPKY
jgi:ACS family hexuronate transporter-like MFS transporter